MQEKSTHHGLDDNSKRIKDAYLTAAYNGLVENKKEFAKALGISPNTLSSSILGRDGYATERLAYKAEQWLRERGIMVDARDNATINGGGSADNLSDNAQKNFIGQDSTEIVRTLTTEMAAQREQYGAQIDRLLGIIEKMQR